VDLATHEAEKEKQAPPSCGEAGREKLLLARAQAGDQDAFGEIVDVYSARILAHLCRLMRQRQEAEDLTQETFLRAYRYLSHYDLSRSFQTWLYTIATNLGRNALRSRKRRGYQISLDGSMDDAGELPVLELPADVLHGREHAEQKESNARVAAAVEQLPRRDAVLVQLHYHEGLTLREAGEILGMREGAAKVALCRARKRLREWLLGEYDDDEL